MYRIFENRFLLNNIGKSLTFNGSSDKAVCSITPATTGFSFGIWIYYIPVSGTTRSILNCVTASNTDGFTLKYNPANNQVLFTIYNSTTTTAQIIYYNLTKVTWFHIVGTFVQNSAKLYVNNVQSGATDTSCSMSTPGTFQISKELAFGNTNWNGNIASFVFQNTSTAWTTTQISDLYYRNTIPTGASYWNFNDNVTDQSGNGATLTLTGTSYSTSIPFPSRSASGARTVLARNARSSI